MSTFSQIICKAQIDEMAFDQRMDDLELNQDNPFKESIEVKKESRIKTKESSKSASRTRRTWSNEEDAVVKQLVQKYGYNWSKISTEMNHIRSSKQIRDRWLSKLDPQIKKTEWTEEEDIMLVDLFAIMGRRWSAIARKIPGRSEIMIKNRFKARFQNLLTEEVISHLASNYRFQSSESASDSANDVQNKNSHFIKGCSSTSNGKPELRMFYSKQESFENDQMEGNRYQEGRTSSSFLNYQTALNYSLHAGVNAQYSKSLEMILKREHTTVENAHQVDPRLHILEKSLPVMNDNALRNYLQQKITGSDSVTPQTKDQAAERVVFLQDCLLKLQGVLLETVKKLEDILAKP